MKFLKAIFQQKENKKRKEEVSKVEKCNFYKCSNSSFKMLSIQERSQHEQMQQVSILDMTETLSLLNPLLCSRLKELLLLVLNHHLQNISIPLLQNLFICKLHTQKKKWKKIIIFGPSHQISCQNFSTNIGKRKILQILLQRSMCGGKSSACNVWVRQHHGLEPCGRQKPGFK